MAGYALLCGVNTNKNGVFRSLEYGVNDAVKMKNLLRLCGYETHLLVGEKLNKRSLVNKARSIAEKVNPGDTLLFYFSGHGGSSDGKQFIFPFNTQPKKTGYTNILSLSGIGELMDRENVNQIFIIDACRELFSAKSVLSDNAQDLTKKGMGDELPSNSRRGIICACSDGAHSHESKLLKGGYFTAMLVDTALEKLDAGERLSLLSCTEAVDRKLEALPGIINEFFPPQPPWALGENLVLYAGKQNVSFSSVFKETHIDINSEYTVCEQCGTKRHFLEMKHCAYCNEEICLKHFRGQRLYCEPCHSLDPFEKRKDVSIEISRHIAKIKIMFLDAYDEVVFAEPIIFEGESHKEKVVSEICDYLFLKICALEPTVSPVSDFERGMIINTFFGFSPFELLKSLHSQKYFSRKKWNNLWGQCEEKIRKISLLGGYES